MPNQEQNQFGKASVPSSDELHGVLISALKRDAFFPYFENGKVAVAVSGGPDSMALTLALSKYAQEERGRIEIHALTVDHGLRPESWQEAEAVHIMMSYWPHVKHSVLKWEGDKPAERIQEAARMARYDLIEQYCNTHGIEGLFLGHQRQDQAETFLFRLAKGSGLDGLSCMKPVQERGAISLLRPFLDVDKDELIGFCEAQNVAFFRDPSNEKERFARVRLRGAREVLEAEGLSDKRLVTTAMRLARAREALEALAKRAFADHVFKNDSNRIVFKNDLLSEPEEIVLRVLKMALDQIGVAEQSYGPREEKIEALVYDLIHADAFRKRTLGGAIFEKKLDEVILICEN